MKGVNMNLKKIFDSMDGIKFAYNMRLKNGSRSMKLRRCINKINAEIENFHAVRDGYIKDTGKESLSSTDPEFESVMKNITEALNVDFDIDIEPFISEDDLEATNVSAKELDDLINIGLLADCSENEKKN
jgi:hypothetical protein